MLRFILIILSLSLVTKTFGQDSSRLMSYHAGFNVNHIGAENPGFVLPVGFGIAVTGTCNMFKIVKPTIELSAVGFPAYVIHFNGNSSEDSKYAIGVYNLLVGTKRKLNKLAKMSLTIGPSFNSRGNELLPGVKPSVELNSRNERILMQVYYLKIINSKVMLNGFTGIAVLFGIR